MRPRANTISHVDGATMGIITGNSSVPRSAHPTHTHHPSLSSIPSVPGFDYRGMGSAQNSVANGLTKLDTSALPIDMANGLRTAPVYGSLIPDYGMNDMILGQGTTINPAQLHFAGSPHGMPNDNPASPFNQNFSGMSNAGGIMEDDTNFDWVNGFDSTMSFANANESAVDGSSPSAMSTGSQSGISEVMLDGSGHHMAASSSAWQNPLLAHTQAPSNHFTMDFSPTSFPEMVPAPETVSPKSLMGQNQFGETSFSTPPPLSSMDPSMLPGMQNNMFHPPMIANGDSNSIHQNQLRSPVTSNSSDTITDSTRQALLTSLSQPGAFGNRKYSQQSSNNAPSPGFLARTNSNFSNTYLLPSTIDLQRYISAYINYFHPHMPFLHIPSLDFETSDFTSNPKSPNSHSSMNSGGITGGGGCLILSMAAIGALYEFDTATSKDLFESAKKMIQLYLEERRKADMSAALSRNNSGRENSVHNTPLWLVQAMLLNVIYGHNCGDKTSADIASTHCAALVSLARAAELTHSLPPESLPPDHLGYGNENFQNGTPESWNSSPYEPPRERRDWLNWKVVEERKRTLYAIFTLSSLLVSAYNHAPALTNSEIQLDLPCDEDLWAAESPQAWRMLGGGAAAEQKTIPFSAALTSLLTASQRQQQRSSSQHIPFGSSVRLEDLPQSDLKPSTFGCLVLIHALHNYIWETRQRHMGRQWTAQETDAMHAHIEPALRAWQSAWASNPSHNIERPNPHGAGPLSADSIPLLDLAYVRLFVNLGRSKEAFWQRDWNAMADELARGSDVIQHTDDGFGNTGLNSQMQTHSPSNMQDAMVDYGSGELNLSKTPTQEQPMPNMSANISRQSSKREQHLRRAAFYAADSLSMSDKLGNTFAEFTSRELPLQCAMCTFDCAQVLAEWVTTLQERIGPYIGILGQDAIDLGQVPGIMLLEEEDIKLLDKISEILNSVERKMDHEAQSTKSLSAIGALKRAPSAVEGGYGSKILISTAYLLDRAAVWPGKF